MERWMNKWLCESDYEFGMKFQCLKEGEYNILSRVAGTIDGYIIGEDDERYPVEFCKPILKTINSMSLDNINGISPIIECEGVSIYEMYESVDIEPKIVTSIVAENMSRIVIKFGYDVKHWIDCGLAILDERGE